MEQSLRISDNVWARVIQIIQEAMLMGIDCADLLRQVRVKIDESDAGTLVLTSGYEKMVEEHHKKLLDEVEKIKADESNLKKFLVSGE